jgi:hypothetical protein
MMMMMGLLAAAAPDEEVHTEGINHQTAFLSALSGYTRS